MTARQWPRDERGHGEASESKAWYLEARSVRGRSMPKSMPKSMPMEPYQFTRTASHQAWYTVVNALSGRFKKFPVDYRVIPWTTFTDPEVARVGLNETGARARDIAYELTVFPLNGLDRAVADGARDGFIKILTVSGKERIPGAMVVGAHAGELLAEYLTAMKHKLGLNKILDTIHAYPACSDASKPAAGGKKRGHTPARVLSWPERYHRWHL